MKNLIVAICQINSIVGDLNGNASKILNFYKKASELYQPDLILFPECSLVGYPPEDLLMRESFIKMNQDVLNKIAKKIHGPVAVIGFIHKKADALFNSAAVIEDCKIKMIYSKRFLPNYGVFDEKRYFTPGYNKGIVQIKGVSVGLSICEDMWIEQDKRLDHDQLIIDKSPVMEQSELGAKLLVNISASPFYAGKFKVRYELLKKWVHKTKCPMIFANLVGGQDELVFDGRSMVVDKTGKLVVVGKSFQEDIQCVQIQFHGSEPVCFPMSDGKTVIPETKIQEIYSALVLGTRDYIEKNGFQNVIVGLSGGIDSALTACIAVDAIGKTRVTGVTMPSRYSSKATKMDAKKLAQNLGIKFLSIPIEQIFKSFLNILSPAFKGTKPNLTEENLQSRIRGTILMALSNKFGYLVLTTGNKSEISVGYCTLYGDTAGGFAVLKDVPKTVVYKLSEYVNSLSQKTLIPKTTILRAPTAELRPNQKDQDTLPSYGILDQIIHGYVEEDQSYKKLLRKGINFNVLTKILKMIDQNEYKRRQSPPGVKITPKSFGKDRRMPITNRFTEV